MGWGNNGRSPDTVSLPGHGVGGENLIGVETDFIADLENSINGELGSRRAVSRLEVQVEGVKDDVLRFAITVQLNQAKVFVENGSQSAGSVTEGFD